MITKIAKCLILVFSICGCANETQTKSFEVSKEQYGEDWPFRINSGIIICQKPIVLFEYEKKQYQLLPDSGAMSYPNASTLFQERENSVLKGLIPDKVRHVKSSAAFKYIILKKCKSI